MPFRERIDAILTVHDHAIREMQQARADKRTAHRHLTDANAALVEASKAMHRWAEAHDAAADMQDAAIEAVMGANRAALAILRGEDGHGNA